MFDYYLKPFYKSKPIIEYLSKMGYEYLSDYLRMHEYPMSDRLEGKSRQNFSIGLWRKPHSSPI